VFWTYAMTEQTKLKTVDDGAAMIAEVSSEKRRRLLKLGASAAPVVLTLSSRSVLACHCRTPSAAGSLTYASHRVQTGEPVVDQGGYEFTAYSYERWLGTGSWPVSKSKKFNSLFGSGPSLAINSPSLSQFQKDLVTAYLNIAKPGNSNVASHCLTLDQLKTMASGSYVSQTGFHLNGEAAIQHYLSENWLLGDFLGRVIR
jgi:hypothetical protein